MSSLDDVRPGDTIAVWFSCGAASAVAAHRTVLRFGHFANVRVINTPMVEEHHDNKRFLGDVERWIDRDIETAVSSKHPHGSADRVWRERKYMAGNASAVCTTEIKKQARLDWEKRNHFDWIVLGFTFDEVKRHERFVLGERGNVLPVLIDARITKAECYMELMAAGIRLPDVYRQGYPNANCLGCVKATSPTYWNHVRVTHPDVFERRAALSRELGVKLVRVENQRIFLDQLPKDAQGQPMKTMKTECGIFCEE